MREDDDCHMLVQSARECLVWPRMNKLVGMPEAFCCRKCSTCIDDDRTKAQLLGIAGQFERDMHRANHDNRRRRRVCFDKNFAIIIEPRAM